VELTAGYRTLQVHSTVEVVRVTLARPDRQNTIDSVLIAELHQVLDAAEHSPRCRMVLIAGTDGVFCTGMDFEEAVRGGSFADRDGNAFFDLLRRFTTVPRVVASVVDGKVAGGGVGLVAASDLAFATPVSTFALPEALWGLLPCSVLPFLVRRVGFQPAYSMTMTTMPVDATQAASTHLVDHVVDDPEPLVRRLSYRIGKVEAATIGEVKRYCGAFAPITDEARDRAVAEFARHLGSMVVRRNLADFVDHRRMPWEHGADQAAETGSGY
jgi:polyketide biosynthesis enoyl-CoA hydratase PksH